MCRKNDRNFLLIVTATTHRTPALSTTGARSNPGRRGGNVSSGRIVGSRAFHVHRRCVRAFQLHRRGNHRGVSMEQLGAEHMYIRNGRRRICCRQRSVVRCPSRFVLPPIRAPLLPPTPLAGATTCGSLSATDCRKRRRDNQERGNPHKCEAPKQVTKTVKKEQRRPPVP